MIGHQIFLVGNLGYAESSMKDMYTDVKVWRVMQDSLFRSLQELKG